MSVTGLVSSGPLLLAIPVAAAAGAVTFLSPCCLPLVPGYLAYITGMSGADASTERRHGGRRADADADLSADRSGAGGGVATRARTSAAAQADSPRGRAVAGTALFVLGFSAVYSLYRARGGRGRGSCCGRTPTGSPRSSAG